MQNVQNKNREIEDLTIIRKKYLGLFKQKLTLNSNNSLTYYSPRNRVKSLYRTDKDFPAIYNLTYIDCNSKELEQTTEKKKTRIDNFGREIKKGGKHKIVFADELHFVKTKEIGKSKINKKGDKNESGFIRRNTYSEFREENMKNSEILKYGKRSNSFDISAKYLIKHYYNIYNLNKGKGKSNKFHNLDIVDFESTKKENKLNTYFLKRNLIIPDEGNVCCSCYCSIY